MAEKEEHETNWLKKNHIKQENNTTEKTYLIYTQSSSLFKSELPLLSIK